MHDDAFHYFAVRIRLFDLLVRKSLVVVIMTAFRFGFPFTLRVPRDIPAHDLRMILLNGMRHLLKESAHQQVGRN